MVAVVEAVRLGTPIYAMANDNWMASIGVAVLMFVAQQAGKTIRWWKKLEIQNREKDRENARLRKELAAHKESESVLRCEVERSHEAKKTTAHEDAAQFPTKDAAKGESRDVVKEVGEHQIS